MSEQNITLIVAIIAAIAAILSPILSALINSIAAYKLKKLDLFFAEKTKAYKNMLEVAAQIEFKTGLTREDEAFIKLEMAIAQIELFSTRKTIELIYAYMNELLDMDAENMTPVICAKNDVIEALQKDLKK